MKKKKSKTKVDIKKYLPDYHQIVDHVYYVDVDESSLPQKYKEEFKKWMVGQTCPLVEGVLWAVYPGDFERWLNLKFNKEPTYFD